MVGGWRRAFCTSRPREKEETRIATEKQLGSNNPSPRVSSTKFGFFSSGSSNPSTPRLQSQPVSSPSLRCRTTSAAAPAIESPKLRCKTTAKSPIQSHRSNPSSPRSPSSFSLLKTTLRLNKSRCGICVQNVKTGQGTAIFTAECSHAFHFPCIATFVRKQGSLVCPVCGSNWREVPLLAVHKNVKKTENEVAKNECKKPTPNDLSLYDDDEPLMSATTGARFNPIPESDENDDENEMESGLEEFQGFFVNPTPHSTKTAHEPKIDSRKIEVRLLPEAALVSVGRSYETYVVVLKVQAPHAPEHVHNNEASSFLKHARRAPIDLVTVLDASESMTESKLQMMKRAMRLVVSSLSSTDRLSIVTFSSTSKRLLPLRRMTPSGRRSARRIVDTLLAGQGASVGDALRKATKVLEDRRERNPVASIMLLSAGHDQCASTTNADTPRRARAVPSSTRFAHVEIPVNSSSFGENGAYGHAPEEDAFIKCVKGMLSVVVQDVRIQLGFLSGSTPVAISGVYSCTGRPTVLANRSGSIRLGDLYAEEERDLLVELKVPTSAIGAHHVLTVRCSYKDPTIQEVINGQEQALLVPRPHAVRSSAPSIERLRNLFFTTRAVAESRRLIEHNDYSSAHHLLSSARALLLQSSSSTADEFRRGLEAEVAELHWFRRHQLQEQRRKNTEREGFSYVDEQGEPLTPTSAWRAAERLAKVAIMRKSLNRVGDLHGFENARF